MTTFIPVVTFWLSQTENVGFEPTVPYGITGFQDQRLQPLGQLSKNTQKARDGDRTRDLRLGKATYYHCTTRASSCLFLKHE